MHIKGTNNAKINVNGNKKEGVSTILTVSANGKILKPIIIAKGKTNVSLKKYKLTDEMTGCYSNNGWTNIGIMKLVIDSVSDHSYGKDTCLLLDQYSSHCSETIKIYALTKKVKLLYVPKLILTNCNH